MQERVTVHPHQGFVFSFDCRSQNNRRRIDVVPRKCLQTHSSHENVVVFLVFLLSVVLAVIDGRRWLFLNGCTCIYHVSVKKY